MRQIGEVLRLAAQHLSYDEIARSVGMSRTTSVLRRQGEYSL
jgi:response regulator of citrate/malate metabolism